MSQALKRASQNSELMTITPLKLPSKWELKRLSDKHKTIIALHIQGVPRVDISGIAGCTPEYVSMIVKQPLAQEYLRSLESHMEEVRRVAGMRAIEVMVEKLDSEDEDIQLKAARLALEANGKLKPSGNESRSAEDVVAAILASAKNITLAVGQNVQVNQSGD